MTAPTLPPIEQEDAARAPEGRLATVRRRLASLGSSAMHRVRGLRGDARSPWIVGPVAAVWAAAIGLAIAAVPMLLVWMATPQSGLTWLESLRVSGLLWTVAHGTPVAIGGVTYSLLPWGLAIVPLLLLGYAGGWASRLVRASSVRDLVILTATASVLYAAVVAVVARIAGRGDAATTPLDAAVHALMLAIVAFGFGATRSSTVDVATHVPSTVRVTIRAGLVAAATLLGAGAVAATVALIVRVDDAVTMAQSLHAGVGGGLLLLLLGLAYVPVLVVWATAYIVGAGVMIGPAIAVSPFVPATAPTQLPPFPLLAALPQSASPLAWALPLLGIAAGVMAGLAIGRRARAESRLVRLVVAVGAAGVSAIVLLVLAYLATGSLGDLRLANLGPSPTTVAVLAFVLVTLGAVPSAVVTSPPPKPRLTVAEPSLDTEREDHDV